MVGLGHLRRNLLLARRFAEAEPDAAILLLTEAREAGVFALPESVDTLSLPAIRKDAGGHCSPRRLAVDLPTLVRLRSAVLESALEHFNPDILIVDHLPRGALGELAAALPHLRARGTRLVLGLRDVLEEPALVRREWREAGYGRDIEHMYDEVWVYGDPAAYDAVREYGWGPGVADRVHFTGYLNPLAVGSGEGSHGADWLASRLLESERFILCQVGGGQDGLRLADAFVSAELPPEIHGVVVAGPFMSKSARASLTRQARRHGGRMHVLNLITEPTELLQRAERVVTMGGYNSACEVIALGKHALVVPRTQPRREQLIRAERLCALGHMELLRPERLTAHALSQWFAQPRPAGLVPARPLDMNGLERATERLRILLSGEPIRRASA